MNRLEMLKDEMEQIRQMKCLSFDLIDMVCEYYRHEIRAEQLRMGVDVDD